MSFAEALRRFPLFNSLDDAELLDILRLAKVVRFKAGDALCHVGDPGDCMWFVEKGHVSVNVRQDNGDYIEVKRVGPGETIGELTLIDSQPRSADLVAVGEVQAYALDRAQFDHLRHQMNPAAYKMLRHLALVVAERLRELNNFATGGIASAPDKDETAATESDKANKAGRWSSWLSKLRKGA